MYYIYNIYTNIYLYIYNCIKVYIYKEKAVATQFSTLAWKIPWTEEPGVLPLWGRTESDTTEVT